jgi:DNA polymerase-4
MNWLFTDMDAYFASVEQTLRPELREKPIGIVPLESDSTCVIAASYEAKRCGVKTGTLVPEARRLCPAITFVRARPHLYVDMHHRILESVDACAPVERVYSIDEWSVRLRGDNQQPARAKRLARSIKAQLQRDFGPWLSCSIGIAPSRLLAKIASDLQKPNGLSLLSVEDLPGRLEHLPLKSLCGIGQAMVTRLANHNVRSVRDLWEIDQSEAVRIWGSVGGAQWWAGFHGQDEPEMPTRRRSMSHGSVLAPKLRTLAGARSVLVRLVCRLAQRMRRKGYFARSLSMSLSGQHGGRHKDQVEVPRACDTPTLLGQFYKLWARVSQSVATSVAPIRKVEVTLSGFVAIEQVPRPLFGEIDKLEQISGLVDRINARWGEQALYFGPAHEYRDPMENKIAFGRIPDRV